MSAHEFEGARKSAAFTHDHFANPKLHDRAAAEVAGHEGGIEDGVAKSSDSPGVAQTIDLGMRHRVAFLHPLVVTDGEQFLPPGEGRADWDSAFA